MLRITTLRLITNYFELGTQAVPARTTIPAQSTTNTRRNNHLLIIRQALRRLAPFHNLSSDIAAGNVWQRNIISSSRARSRPYVQMIQGAGAYTNKNFSIADNRVWSILVQ